MKMAKETIEYSVELISKFLSDNHVSVNMDYLQECVLQNSSTSYNNGSDDIIVIPAIMKSVSIVWRMNRSPRVQWTVLS